MRGRPYKEWSSTIQELKKAERPGDALKLALECAHAANATTLITRKPQGSRFTEMAAIIYRADRNYDSEVQVLEEHLLSLRSIQVDGGASTERVRKRLARTLELRAASYRMAA